MPKTFSYAVLFLLVSFSASTCVFARDDIAGSADHPKLPRIAGSAIISYFSSDYGEHDFVTNYDEKNRQQDNKGLESINKEGKLTRLVYSLQSGQTPLFALRNYQEAFAAVGDVNELYECKKESCYKDLGNRFIWSKDKRINSNERVRVLDHMYASFLYHKESLYWSAEIQSETASYTVSFYASTINRLRNKNDTDGYQLGQTMVHIDIVETASFKSDLAVVEASEIKSAIADKGHVALYGLFFDTGNDQLSKESEPALVEVSKALNTESLNLYVVGHTNNVRSVASNQALSERRAKSIVESLTTQYGIDGTRLVPIGVGLAVPVASNIREEGRDLNCRVELVGGASQ